MPVKNIKSAVVVADLLGTQGFTEHTAAMARKYSYRKNVITPRQQKSIGELKTAFSGIMSKLTKPETLVIGKYIGFLEKMQFDAGLRIGLTAFLKEKNDS